MEERRKREFDPTMHMLHECLEELEKNKRADKYTEERLRELYRFFEVNNTLYQQVRRWPTSALLRLAKAGDKVLHLLRLDG